MKRSFLLHRRAQIYLKEEKYENSKKEELHDSSWNQINYSNSKMLKCPLRRQTVCLTLQFSNESVKESLNQIKQGSLTLCFPGRIPGVRNTDYQANIGFPLATSIQIFSLKKTEKTSGYSFIYFNRVMNHMEFRSIIFFLVSIILAGNHQVRHRKFFIQFFFDFDSMRSSFVYLLETISVFSLYSKRRESSPVRASACLSRKTIIENKENSHRIR